MKSVVLICASALALTACQGGDRPNIELIQDMFESPAIKAQEEGMRLPPEGTVPVGFKPYRYATDPAAAARELKNPMAGDDSAKALYVGMKMYETNCAVCHGLKGEGGESAHSVVSAAMALKPPALVSDKVRAMSDGQVYHIITMGQGVMGPYASHVPQNQRWQLVNYIRQLQKK